MIKRVAFLVLLTITLWPLTSLGQEKFYVPVTCHPSSYLENHLRVNYSESLNGTGLLGDRTSFELWISENGVSWSFLFRPRQGVLCLVATGTNWHEVVNGIPIRDRGD